MNKEEIDEFLKAVIEEDEEKYLEIMGRLFGVSSEEIKQGLNDKYYQMLVNEIENGDYEYFKSLVTNPEYKEFVIEIFSEFSEDKNKDKYELIERREELALSPGDLRYLIKSINDEKFTRECIEKREELGLNSYDISYLIRLIEDKNFIKECVFKNEELGLDSYAVSDLIKEVDDVQFTQECIEKREELSLESSDIFRLIKTVKEEDFLKGCIEKREELNLRGGDVAELLQLVEDKDFVKECTLKNKEFGIDFYVKELVEFINEDEFTAEVLEKAQELNLYERMELLKSIKDNEIKKRCILEGNGGRYQLKEIILSIEDEEFTKECVRKGKSLRLYYSEIEDLINLVNNEEFTKECILKSKELGLSNFFVRLKLEHIDDVDFKKECILKGEELELESKTIKKIIVMINEKDFTKECIFKGINLGLDNSNLVELIQLVNEEEFTKECIFKNDELYLEEQDVMDLIQLVEDKEFTKECILKGKELQLNSYSIANLIESINDKEFTKECVLKGKELGLNSFPIARLIKNINDNEFTKECVLEIKLDPGSVKELINLVNEEEFTKECILKRKELNLDSKYLVDKLKELNDSDFAKLMIKNREDMELDGEVLCEAIKLSDTEMFKKINFDKLEELLTMNDAEYIKNHLLDNVILKNMENENVDVDKINEEIEKTYEIFLTNDLPKNFKYFEFFKNHERNYYSNNSEFYPEHDREKRDKIIAGDLFRTLLESDNIKMRNFLENLYNGNLALDKNDDSQISKAVLLKYRDVLYELLDVVEPNTISKTDDYKKDLNEIRKYLNLEEKEDIGEVLLLKYFENIGLNYKKSEEPLIETLLEHMNLKKQIAQRNNSEEFILEEGDVIKGTALIYLEDFLQNGIRAKEFLMKGTMVSDCTPLDTDFSEITEENLQGTNLESVLNSTFTGASYGRTYLVIKKENYENDEISYSSNYGNNKTRYFRTGIGATNISAIITEEWNDEYKYILASNGFYIPVIDKETEKVLFTEDEYKKIRETMQGLSHFGTQDFILDEKANNISIEEQAEELRENAKGKISTEEKREKVVDKIRNNIGKLLTTEMLGDISGRFLELIDTGSTGRGTNIPGDGDFDFMLKCKDKEEQSKMIAKIKTFISGRDKGGTNEFNIRYTDVKIDGLDEVVELDVTSEKKRLETEYSSDMAVRDRLNSIQAKYGEEGLKTVVDNIIIAKKILKENGVYKKANSIGGTDFGGFGGIGVENWILQNGGSFVRAMETFLENTVDENGNEVSFEQFKRKYPIYDFGQNHKDLGNPRHDHYVEGLTEEGFYKLKEVCREQLKLLEDKTKTKDKFTDSIIRFTEEANGYKFSDLSQTYGLLAKFRTYELSKENNNRGVNE